MDEKRVFFDEAWIFFLLSRVSADLMTSYQSDILLDTPEILTELGEGKDVVMYVAHNHFDLASRFQEEGDDDPYSVSAFNKNKQTLGAEYILAVKPDGNVRVQLMDDEKGHRYSLEDFKRDIVHSRRKIHVKEEKIFD